MDGTSIVVLHELMAQFEWPWRDRKQPFYWTSLEITTISDHCLRVVSEMRDLPEVFRRDMRFDLNKYDWQSDHDRCRRLGSWLDAAERTLRLRQAQDSAAEPHLLPFPAAEKLRFLPDELIEVVGIRWIEAQKCMHARNHTAAIVMMGSVLEGLLIARIKFDFDTVRAASKAPRRKDGALVDLSLWKLAQMIDIARELGWLKPDRALLSHGLRELRNTVHPWHDASIRARFDAASCRTAWSALQACVADLVMVQEP